MSRFSQMITVAIVLLSHSLSAEEAYLGVVFRDSFDEGIHRWTFSEEPEVEIVWDETEGSPRVGSINLSLTQALNHFDFFQALGPCMSALPGETWRIETMVKTTRTQGGRCAVLISYFDSSDCTGEGSSGGGGGAPPPEPKEWRLEERTSRTFTKTRSARAVLLLSVPGRAEPMTCHFDSVVVSNNRAPAPSEVPTLSSLGLAVLASLLTLAAFVLCRRVSR